MKTWEQARDEMAMQSPLHRDGLDVDALNSLIVMADWGREWALGSNHFELYKAERAKSKKLLEALEFYADSSSYDTTIERNGYTDPSEWDQIPPVICDDDGYIARDAIAAYKGEE